LTVAAATAAAIAAEEDREETAATEENAGAKEIGGPPRRREERHRPEVREKMSSIWEFVFLSFSSRIPSLTALLASLSLSLSL